MIAIPRERLSVNVSMLFGELPFVQRFAAVRAAGFDAVEFWWPAGEDLDAVSAAIADAGVRVALINFDGGDIAHGRRGLLSDPDTEDAFRANVPIALKLGAAVGCRAFNALVGLRDPRQERPAQLERAARNVAWAAERAAAHGARVLIEPINRFDVADILLPTTAEALALIEAVDHANVALQFDCYHAQRGEGNVVATLREVIGDVGHVQLADSPDRHEPGTGELRFDYILSELARLGYDGFVGLEYTPSVDSAASLQACKDLLLR